MATVASSQFQNATPLGQALGQLNIVYQVDK